MSLEVMRSSLGYSMLLHSRQKRKLICSCLAGASVAEVVEGAGDAIVGVVVWSFGAVWHGRVLYLV